MRCVYHPDQEAACLCRGCNMGICPGCTERKKIPAAAYAAGGAVTIINPAGDRTANFCKRGCDGYRRLAERERSGAWSGLAIGLGILAVFTGIGALFLVLVLSLGIAGLDAVAREVNEVASRSSALGVDLTDVAVGQRYIFENVDYKEVWTIVEVDARSAAYRVSWIQKDARESDRGRERWRPPVTNKELRRALRRGPTLRPRAVEGAEYRALEITNAIANTTYAIRDGRLAFPGVLRKEFLGRPRLTRTLIKVEGP